MNFLFGLAPHLVSSICITVTLRPFPLKLYVFGTILLSVKLSLITVFFRKERSDINRLLILLLTVAPQIQSQVGS